MAALYAPLVYRWTLRFGLNRDDAADLTQQVFTVVAGQIDQFRRDRPGDSFRAWLFGITRNHVRHHHRDAARRPAPVGGTSHLVRLRVLDDGSSSTTSRDGMADLLRRALEFLRTEFAETTWQAFWRTAVDRHRPQDVAADLGVSVNAVYLARSRVVRRLREMLAEGDE